MKRIVVSAPGKIYLMGEHAVVYGKPALLAAINRRLTVTIEYYQNSKQDHKTKDNKIISKEPTEQVRQAITVIKNFLEDQDNQPVQITIDSAINPGYHLGSSAALAVALTGAMMQFFKNRFVKKEINDIAYRVEKIFHGNPSGGDNTTVTYGGLLLYQKKSEKEKLFKRLSFSIPQALNHFCLINTGRSKENTGELVKGVNERFKLHPSTYNKLFDSNEFQVKRIVDALKDGDEKILIDAIQKGEQTLEGMGVVSDMVKPLIRAIEKSGGAAKILGGGGVSEGVGFILCYTTDRNAIERIVSQFHYSTQTITLGEEGVRVEHKLTNPTNTTNPTNELLNF